MEVQTIRVHPASMTEILDEASESGQALDDILVIVETVKQQMESIATVAQNTDALDCRANG